MKPKTLVLLEFCIATGIKLGYTRAFKHTDTPSEDAIQDSIYTAITNEIHQWFDFPELNQSYDINKDS
jgi:hypothetical protein